MTWSRREPPSQRYRHANQTKRTVSSKDPVKGRRGKECNSKLDYVGQLNKPGHGQCWPRNQIKRIQLQKDCASQEMKSIYRSSRSASESTLSGSSCTPDCEKTGLLNNGSSCSERLSISSTLQDLSIESSIPSSSTHERKLDSEQIQVSSGTSTCSDSQCGKQKRNSSGASFYTLRPKLRFSYEHLSKSTIDQAVHAVDYGSSAGSVTTYSCLKSEKQVTSRGSVNLDKDSECSGYDQPCSSGSKGESDYSNRRPIHCHEAARIIVKDESFPIAVRTRSCSNIRERTTETRGSHVGSFQRKQLVSGKANSQQTKAGKGHVQESKCQTKPKFANSIVHSSLTTSKMRDGKWRSVDCDRLQCKTEESCSKRGPLDCGAQMASERTRQDLKGQSLAMAVLGGRRTGQTSGGSAPEYSSKFDSSEQDLAALVAQHNRKIRTLGTDGCKKVFRAV